MSHVMWSVLINEYWWFSENSEHSVALARLIWCALKINRTCINYKKVETFKNQVTAVDHPGTLQCWPTSKKKTYWLNSYILIYYYRAGASCLNAIICSTGLIWNIFKKPNYVIKCKYNSLVEWIEMVYTTWLLTGSSVLSWLRAVLRYWSVGRWENTVVSPAVAVGRLWVWSSPLKVRLVPARSTPGEMISWRYWA